MKTVIKFIEKFLNSRTEQQLKNLEITFFWLLGFFLSVVLLSIGFLLMIN